MTDRSAVKLARATVAIGGALALGGSVIFIAVGHADLWWSSFAMFGTVLSLFFAVFVWLVIAKQPRNKLVWIMAVSAISAGLFVILSSAAVLLVADDARLVAEVLKVAVVPHDLPASVAWLRVVGEGAGDLAFFLWLTLGLLLFPDGRLPSPRWRWVARAAVAALILVVVGWAWSSRPWSTDPNDTGLLFNLALGALMPLVVLSLAGLVVRFRRSVGASRQEFKWIVWGTSILVPVIIFAIIAGGTEYGDLAYALFAGAEAIALTAYGIAVGKYRLFDIDAVISKTVAYGALAAFVTAIYVAIAVGLGGLIGGSSLWLSVLATALVAIAFEPARQRMHRWANRIVYGPRATPYEVLSEITGRLTAVENEEGLLERMAAMLGAGTGAVRAAVWLAGPSGFTTAAVAPPGEPMTADDVGSLPGEKVPIEHDGESLGALTVEKGRGDTLTPTELGLVDDLAGSAALVLRKLRLDATLEAKAAELQESRRRLVDAHDVERRRLERELHDGAQQLVVAIKVKLGLARQVAAAEGVPKTGALITQMEGDTQLALEQIRALARGVYPPLLQADGLTAAIPALAELSLLDTRITVSLSRRHPLPVEGAVYFCISEALTNASKHGRGPISVDVLDDESGLSFAVTDSGPGFDPSLASRGSGLNNMADRLETLGGSFRLTSQPGGSTTVSGRLPIAVEFGATMKGASRASV